MAEIYAVETVLSLKSNVLEQVGLMIREFEKLGKLITKTARQFETMTGALDGAVIASERMVKAQALIAEESSKTAANYRKIAAESAASGRGGGGGGGHGGSGMLAGGVAVAGIFTGYHAVKTEMENQRELAKFRNDKSITDAEAAQLRAKAEEMTSAAPGTTVATNLGILLDTFTVIRDVSKSMAVGVDLAKVQGARNMMGGKDSGSYDAVKFAETLQMIYGPDHQVSADEMRNVILKLQKVETAFAGRVSPDMMLGFAKQARTSGMMVDESFIFEDLPAIIQAIGGQRTGTGLQAFTRQFVGGTMTKGKMEQMQAAGLIDKDAKWEHGHVKDIDKHLQGGGEASRNPETWVKETLIPLLKKNSVNVDDKNEVAKWIMQNGATNTGAGFLSELVIGRENIGKDAAAIRDKTTDDPLKSMEKFAPGTAALLTFNSALDQFLSELGKDLMPQATAALEGLTTAIKGITGALKGEDGKTWVQLGETLTMIFGLFAASKVLKIAAGLLKLGEGIKAIAEVKGLASIGGELQGAAAGLSALRLGILALPLALKGDTGPGGPGPATDADKSAAAAAAAAINKKNGTTGGFWHELSKWYGAGDPVPPDGFHKESYIPSGSSKAPMVQTINYIQIDGKTVAKSVSTQQARAMSLPPAGSTRFDGRMAPSYPGNTVPA